MSDVKWMAGILIGLVFGNFAQAQDLALNWKPEPEFGGFYEALLDKLYEKEGLSTKILPGGAGQPVTQLVASKKVEFGIAAADEVILARAQGAKVVALFAVYQNDPQGFMVHPEKGVNSLKELFQSEGTIALQKGLPYTLWIEKAYAPVKAKIVPYTGGISSFLQDKKFSQQCFVTAEPIAARKENLKPRTFLISESGFNPYLTVVIAHEDTLTRDSVKVAKFLKATREGWKRYLKDGTATNVEMQKLNPSMDLETFKESARIQKEFIETEETRKKGLGVMTKARWEKLYQQLMELNLVPSGMVVTQFFR
ncbi:MAG: ABC transporter substrate-binding protein [Bdellovibrionales bacterium]|nr:ABC transporter substrate-binding protein [Bdellovibrionales bacterium]